VETASEKEFKSSVLGAYERGERSISVHRLQRLALLYDVPMGSLLPGSDPPARRGRVQDDGGGSRGSSGSDDTELEARLRSVAARDPDLLMRYVRMIQAQRHGSGGGRPVSLRAEDVRVLEILLEPQETPGAD
jgi:transcriptional regulator with XRE-family HTH domain